MHIDKKRIILFEVMLMKIQIVLPVVISFLLSVVLSPVVIPFLKKLGVGQTIREEGPQSHKIKSGTPTMGGVIILSSIVITSLGYISRYPKILPVLFVTLGFGLIGFLDDYIKVVLKRSEGLTPGQKFLCQMFVTAVFTYYLTQYTTVPLSMQIPFSDGKYLDMGIWTVPMLFFVIIGTVNGTNFTDGLDGLASGVTILVATFFAVAAIGRESGLEPVTCAVVGSLMGFLLFNVYPARIFMGDTGSLALGGFVSATAIMMQMPLFIAIVGFIYLLEVVSVIIQVGYFKLSGGKRIFKMAPIHHHLEKCGWSETRVVALFSVVTAILCLIGLLGL